MRATFRRLAVATVLAAAAATAVLPGTAEARWGWRGGGWGWGWGGFGVGLGTGFLLAAATRPYYAGYYGYPSYGYGYPYSYGYAPYAYSYTLTVMGIAAFTPVMGITRAIDTEVTTLTAEPIIDTRATILIAGRGGRLTQRQLNDEERPPTGGLSFCKMFRPGPGVGVLPLGHAHQ